VTEPVVGIGTRSGETYSFAERGPEFVSKGAPSGRAVAPVINIQNNTGSDIKEDNVQFDVEKMVLGIVLNGAANNKNGFRQSLSQVMRG
jgi:hypothetical protein